MRLLEISLGDHSHSEQLVKSDVYKVGGRQLGGSALPFLEKMGENGKRDAIVRGG